MLSMLIAYNDSGDVIATLDHVVARDDSGDPIGLVDFEAIEASGGELLDVWNVEIVAPDGTRSPARGSKTWPEWIGSHAHDFKVELEGPPGRKRIKALVHKTSGHRRERAAVAVAVADRIQKANGQPADIRDIVGGPDRPLLLDEQGRTKGRFQAGVTPKGLPHIKAAPR